MSERILILLRHAKSDWSGNENDIERPLNRRGRQQAPLAGHWLSDSFENIDLALISPATRALQTWELASAQFQRTPPTRIDDRIYAASADELLDVVRTVPDDVNTVVLVGHNPGIENLVVLLTGQSASMPTSAIAVIGWDGSWAATGSATATVQASGRPPAGPFPAS
jgi:phosphohistidine phosphatase